MNSLISNSEFKWLLLPRLLRLRLHLLPLRLHHPSSPTPSSSFSSSSSSFFLSFIQLVIVLSCSFFLILEPTLHTSPTFPFPFSKFTLFTPPSLSPLYPLKHILKHTYLNAHAWTHTHTHTYIHTHTHTYIHTHTHTHTQDIDNLKCNNKQCGDPAGSRTKTQIAASEDMTRVSYTLKTILVAGTCFQTPPKGTAGAYIRKAMPIHAFFSFKLYFDVSVPFTVTSMSLYFVLSIVIYSFYLSIF